MNKKIIEIGIVALLMLVIQQSALGLGVIPPTIIIIISNLIKANLRGYFRTDSFQFSQRILILQSNFTMKQQK